MKKIYICIGLLLLTSCAELQSVVKNITTEHTTKNSNGSQLSVADVSGGLKQALELGVAAGVDMLSQKEGYFKNEMVRILLPSELKKVDETLRRIGLGSLADQGLKVLNQAAEEAVHQAKPIFVSAIKNLSFVDAMAILSGNKNAATEYLKQQTNAQLVQAFQPKIEQSLERTGANLVWKNIIGKYNEIPFVKPVQPNLTSYVTEKAIDGLFLQIEQKEAEIRQNVSARTTPLLQKVFGN